METTGSEGFDHHLGLQVSSSTADEVVATFEVRPHLLQPYGLLHGGVLCSVVDTVGSAAGAAWWGDRGDVVGTSNSTSFLRAVRDGRLTARATPVHRGRTSQLWTVDVHDDRERLVARGEVRLANLAPGQGA